MSDGSLTLSSLQFLLSSFLLSFHALISVALTYGFILLFFTSIIFVFLQHFPFLFPMISLRVYDMSGMRTQKYIQHE